ncbi:MAG: hypothetical protein M1820_009368 [Bogoriella megaspora]|nr:MAG: hypothetical protein M1820_009368 [Bogoriella megaspora]
MPPPNSAYVAPPTRNIFDPWNSSSTGHQRAENRLSGSTSWRDSRNLKLASQFRAAQTGGRRIADTVGAGSENFGKDGRKSNGGWEKGAKGLRTGGQKSLWECMGSKITKEGANAMEKNAKGVNSSFPHSAGEGELVEVEQSTSCSFPPEHTANENSTNEEADTSRNPKPLPPQIFRNLVFYINGSTMPHISDHKLKRLLSMHGGNLSIALGRRKVTHVIVGIPCSTNGTSKGAGGGLAGSKIQKEVTRIGGKGVKFVGVEWILASIKAGTRLPEVRFETVNLGGAGQRSVLGMLEKIEKSEKLESG